MGRFFFVSFYEKLVLADVQYRRLTLEFESILTYITIPCVMCWPYDTFSICCTLYKNRLRVILIMLFSITKRLKILLWHMIQCSVLNFRHKWLIFSGWGLYHLSFYLCLFVCWIKSNEMTKWFKLRSYINLMVRQIIKVIRFYDMALLRNHLIL